MTSANLSWVSRKWKNRSESQKFFRRSRIRFRDRRKCGNSKKPRPPTLRPNRAVTRIRKIVRSIGKKTPAVAQRRAHASDFFPFRRVRNSPERSPFRTFGQRLKNRNQSGFRLRERKKRPYYFPGTPPTRVCVYNIMYKDVLVFGGTVWNSEQFND